MKVNRRTFIKRLIALVITVEGFYLIRKGIAKTDKVTDIGNTMFNAGRVDDFKNGQTYPFAEGRFYLCRYNDGGFMAFSAQCTHLKCIVKQDVSVNQFVCPCHRSQFNEYGEILSAPATRSLDLLPIEIKVGIVWVNVHKKVKRDLFEVSQLTYA